MLVVLWVVVLAPGLWKRHRERTAAGSIDSFHLQLHLLEHAGPKIVAPAYRLASSDSTTGVRPGATGFPAVSSMPGRPNLMLVESAATEEHGRYSASVAYPGGPDPLRRHRARKRRRDALTVAVLVIVSTGLLGTIHGLRALWVLSALAVLALGAYLVLWLYARTLTTGHQQDRRPRPADASSRAAAGYPGAWDEAADPRFDPTYWEDEEYEPRRVAAR